MTVERRYQVFVSSTYEDLTEERREVMQALLELDAIPSGMELFPAANDDQWTLIRRVIDDCDYYLVVIGGRYGSTAPNGKSYTQLEYEYAVKQGKPVMAFLHKDPTSIPARRSESSEDGRQKLQQFRELTQQRMVKHWTTATELGSVVSRSLIKLIRDNATVGWVRGDQVMDESSAQEILRLRKRIEELEAHTVGPVGNLEELAQGDDELVLHFSFRWRESGRLSSTSASWVVDTTWNEVFAKISPLMIDQAADGALHSALNALIQEKAVPQLLEVTEWGSRTIFDFRLADDDFRAIIVQLRALNLIQEHTKSKRGVHDRSTYFRLTQGGDRQMVLLRAIRRGSELRTRVGVGPKAKKAHRKR